MVRSRSAALGLLAVLVLGNIAAVAILVVGLVTTNTNDLSGGELLFTAFAIWSANAIVFGLLFWELEAGGPVERILARSRTSSDFLFPQDDGSTDEDDWRPQAWDYLYVSLTNSIALQPHRHDAAYAPRESRDGSRIRDRGGHRSPRRRTGCQRSR